MGVDPGQHLLLLERLGHVIDTTNPKPLHQPLQLVLPRKEDHRDVPRRVFGS